MTVTDDFINTLPKVELHVHLVGSASVPTVLELAQRHTGHHIPTNEAALREFFGFRDFPHFAEVYFAVNSLYGSRRTSRRCSPARPGTWPHRMSGTSS